MPSRVSVVCSTAVLLSLALGPGFTGAMHAADEASACVCPDIAKEKREPALPRPMLADARPPPDGSDETATLEAVHLALTELGDGSSYLWYRRGGDLSGVVQPTSSFVDANGRICRHIVLVLSREAQSKRTEGIACRLDNGAWQLGG